LFDPKQIFTQVFVAFDKQQHSLKNI